MVTQNEVSFGSCTTFLNAQAELQGMVDALCASDEIALARIWLIQSDRLCQICQSESTGRNSHLPELHLVASSGQSQNPSKPEVWNRLDGAFHRFPLNSQKIGRIAATGEPLLVHQSGGENVLARPDWLAQEGIQSFFGYPLTRGDHVFGVMAVFSRLRLSDRELRFVRQIADGGARLLEDAGRLSEQSHRLTGLETEVLRLNDCNAAAYSSAALGGTGPAARKLAAQISLAASHTGPILITGESGVGKDAVARQIHHQSSFQRRLFLIADAESLTSEQLEMWTGARSSMSTCDTILIRGIERTPLEVQERLVGLLANEIAGSDANDSPRMIATSTADLPAEVAAGRLRQDLYCSWSVVEIQVPPLRQRLDDLSDIASEMMREISSRHHQPMIKLDQRSLAQLARHEWTGNLRELQLVLECALIQMRDGPISLDGYLKLDPTSSDADRESSYVRADELKQQERENIIACLKRCHWKVYGPGGAAELLGLPPTTLMYRMKVLKIQKPGR